MYPNSFQIEVCNALFAQQRNFTKAVYQTCYTAVMNPGMKMQAASEAYRAEAAKLLKGAGIAAQNIETGDNWIRVII